MLATLLLLHQQPESQPLLLRPKPEDSGTAIGSSTFCLLVWFLHLWYHGFSTLMYLHPNPQRHSSFFQSLKRKKESYLGGKQVKDGKQNKKKKLFIWEWVILKFEDWSSINVFLEQVLECCIKNVKFHGSYWWRH